MFKMMAAAALGAMAYLGGRRDGVNSVTQQLRIPVPSIPCPVERTPTGVMFSTPLIQPPLSSPGVAAVFDIRTGKRILK